MNGDRAKQESAFSRWVGYFEDGQFTTTRNGKENIPSECSKGKKYNRRWLRRKKHTDIQERLE